MEPSFFPKVCLENLIKVYENNIYDEILAILLDENDVFTVQSNFATYIQNHKRMKPKDKTPFIEKLKNSMFFNEDFLKIKPLINISKSIGITYLSQENFLELFDLLQIYDCPFLSSMPCLPILPR